MAPQAEKWRRYPLFFESDSGALYPVALITRIGGARSKGEVTVSLSTGEEVEITREERRRLEQIGPVFPAQPGTFVLYPNGKDAADLGRSLVVGWSLGSDGAIWPITAEGLNDGMAAVTPAIQTPDGSVSIAHDRSWNSVADFLATQKA